MCLMMRLADKGLKTLIIMDTPVTTFKQQSKQNEDVSINVIAIY
jgi:hypothetical protein